MHEFNYLNSSIIKDGRSKNIKKRLAEATRTFHQNKNLFSTNIRLGVRKRLLKLYMCGISSCTDVKRGLYENLTDEGEQRNSRCGATGKCLE